MTPCMKQKHETAEMAPLSSYSSRIKEVWDVSYITMKAQMLSIPYLLMHCLHYNAQKNTKYP